MTSSQGKAGMPVAVAMNMLYTGLGIARSPGQQGISAIGFNLMAEESSQTEEAADDFMHDRGRNLCRTTPGAAGKTLGVNYLNGGIS